MLVSIVTTIYSAESYLQQLYQRIIAVVQKNGWDYEIIFVNDGAKDHSLDVLLLIQKSDPRVVVVNLSRNFGQHPAIVTGLAQTKGDLVFYLESDLEEAPEWLDDYYKEMQKEQTDVVFGVRRERKRSRLSDLQGIFFYWSLKHIFKVNNIKNIVGARLMSRRYVDAILQYKQKSIALSAICHDIGFKQAFIAVDKGYKGHSSYNWSKKLAHSIDYLTCATARPLLWASCIAFLMACGVLPLVFIGVTIGWLTAAIATSAAVCVMAITLFSAMIMALMGVIGIYLYKVTTEVSSRPLTIIQNIYKTEV